MKFKIPILLALLNVSSLFAYKIDTLYVRSDAMHKTIPNLVILPDGYAHQKEGFSVVYLLHGAGGDYTSWSEHSDAMKLLSDQYNVVIVCPDAGRTSWYFDSPIDASMRYETYVSKELIASVDATYNSIPSKSHRAIAGLSMGGHGALYLSFKHPDVWGAAGSMSGGVDIRPFPNNWDLSLRLGSLENHPENWEENTVVNMIGLLKGRDLKLMIDCGVDDFFYKVNMQLHAELLAQNIPHDFVIRPGSHRWSYWNQAILYQMLFFSEFFHEEVL